jgi:hypothetical protein
MLLHIEDVLQLREEPLVDVRYLPNLVDRVPAVECGRDCEDALVSRVDKLLVDVLHVVVLDRRGMNNL